MEISIKREDLLHGLYLVQGVVERRTPQPVLANVLIETDYPHTDTSWPYTKEEVGRMCEGLSDELVYKIVRGNAINMLSLDVT